MIVLVAMKVIPSLIATPAYAGETYTPHETSMINSINTVWTLVAAFLVFGMQAGFVMLEAGFARARETVNVLMECIFDTCLCGLLFWAIGYDLCSVMVMALSEKTGFSCRCPITYEATGIPILAHWIFQFAFADTCSTIVSGAMIGRTCFRGDIIYSMGIPDLSILLSGTGPGDQTDFWLLWAAPGISFQASVILSVILPFHGCAYDRGIASLAGAIVLGPRIGRIFKRDGGGMPAPHNLTLPLLGALFSGLAGMVLIRAVHCPLSMLTVLAVLLQIQHWLPVVAV